MTRELVSWRFPYLPLEVEVLGRTHTVEALIDTGFDGSLSLPSALFVDGGPAAGEIRGTLADGTVRAINYYIGIVKLRGLGQFEAMILALGDGPLVGRRIIEQFAVTLDHGRRVVVEP